MSTNSSDRFRQIIFEKLSTENINATCSGIEKILQICINTLNIFPPFKKKYSRKYYAFNEFNKRYYEKKQVKKFIPAEQN